MVVQQTVDDLALLRERIAAAEELLRGRRYELGRLFADGLDTNFAFLAGLPAETRNLVELCIIFTTLARTIVDAEDVADLVEHAELN